MAGGGALYCAYMELPSAVARLARLLARFQSTGSADLDVQNPEAAATNERRR